MLGEKVYSQIADSHQPIANSTMTIDISGKPAGMYFYRIITESGNKLIAEGKLVVE
jgi:hypothetical protein